jgi:hypothetical protein
MKYDKVILPSDEEDNKVKKMKDELKKIVGWLKIDKQAKKMLCGEEFSIRNEDEIVDDDIDKSEDKIKNITKKKLIQITLEKYWGGGYGSCSGNGFDVTLKKFDDALQYACEDNKSAQSNEDNEEIKPLKIFSSEEDGDEND